jgi:hypothetical protein
MQDGFDKIIGFFLRMLSRETKEAMFDALFRPKEEDQKKD